ncbi:MAG TPA: UbiX family flavin prenyltransferase [Mycobacterium sp.]|nr:UbiX family flavin prenyltransferase [Mycobacterium sp.]
MPRLIVGITGASGSALGIRALQLAAECDGLHTDLIVTRAGRDSIHQETDWSVRDVLALADTVHDDHDLASTLASGSSTADAMLIAPCSIKTLSAVANCYDATLLVRAADVMLKERRPLVLMLRETPLHVGHLRLMTQVTEAGGIVMPPVPAFYLRPSTVDEMIDHMVMRALDVLGLTPAGMARWQGRVVRHGGGGD